MKNRFLFLSLAAAAILAGCAKNEADTPDTGAPATYITAKAQGAGDIELDTKGPVTGTSLNGQTAEVYASTYDISSYTGSLLATFSNVYARGTMTFDDSNYVDYDTADFGGLNGGNSLLPQDGTEVYLYSFYPKGWDRTVSTPGGVGTECESMSYTFDGKTDVMSTWLTSADNLTIKYNDVANMPDKADFTFKHLLTRYHIQMKANDADAITAWGHVKSIQIKEADPAKPVNQVLYDKSVTSVPMILGYVAHATNTTPAAFFKLTGTPAAPTYSDNKFATADYASAFVLTQSYQNAGYSMVAPVTVDATSAAELMLVVNTVLADGKEIAVEVPVTLDQSKFTANANSTRGFSITLSLNFRVGVIQATAVAEEWKDYGIQYEDVDVPRPPVIGDLEVDANGILTMDGKMLFFKFGSVVGFTQEGAWGADKVLFNPVTGSPSYASYTGIPVYTTADWSAHKNVSDAAYHNGTNVKAGKGDPCKLVGLSASQIQSMTAAQIDAYNSGWRLPTKDEQITFTGQTADAYYTAHFTPSDSRYDKWYYSTGSAGGYFPKGQESQKLNYLPFAGYRMPSTLAQYVDGSGFYWSSEVHISSTSAYNMNFNDGVVRPLGYDEYAYGFGARCVR